MRMTLQTKRQKRNDKNVKTILTFGEDEKYYFYICHTCKKHLLKGRMPAMSSANGLSLQHVPEDIKLTELENNLIAKKILFQKIFQLPKSRIAAVKDKLVNIPIQEKDIFNTLEALPRTTANGGLVEVKLKSKQEYTI